MKISLYNATTNKTILLASKKVVIGRDFFSVSTFHELFILVMFGFLKLFISAFYIRVLIKELLGSMDKLLLWIQR